MPILLATARILPSGDQAKALILPCFSVHSSWITGSSLAGSGVSVAARIAVETGVLVDVLAGPGVAEGVTALHAITFHIKIIEINPVLITLFLPILLAQVGPII
jgi:hypothetical protein